MGLRRQSQAVIKHRDCQPAEGAEPRSRTALDAGRAGVRASLPESCALRRDWVGGFRAQVSEGELQLGSEDDVPALGNKIGVSVGVGARLEGFGRSQLLPSSLFDIGQPDRAL